ncbi:hypothetical protein MMF93_30350 [Streptomyces tubbatahanensis]|uniref:Uncharacterized protein n=1 Tax=Streptomyces tubbatahanensis TaxID=2923272 RepID=A0ABY3Y0X6_9ACTN|nr:hypothetical protein [Streptomyces tubbatahanensis]UNT00286.1 hypothetical protein MMF93_30350 [Streptomyces tubbatahanensis]
MLHAKRIHLPSQEYELAEDGRALTTFSLRRGRIGARFTLGGVDYLVRTHRFSGVYELLDADAGGEEDGVIATTDRVRRSWHLTCSGRTVPFRRSAAADREFTMIGDDGEPAGTIRRTGHVRSEVTADLPSLELVLQVFVVVVVLLRRRRKRAAAAVRSSSLAGG